MSAALLLLGPAVSSAAASGPRSELPASAVGPSFAERAGFDPNRLGSVASVHVSAAVLTVDVVFAPRASVASAGEPNPVPARAYASSYGLAPSEFRNAIAYFAGFGLAVHPFSNDRLGLELVGPARAMGAAFRTNLSGGTYHGTPVVFPSTAPSLPPSLEAEVAGVVGLSSGFDTFSFSLRSAGAVGGPAGGSAAGPELTTPARARAIYGYSGLYNLSGGPNNSSGHGIAVILWGAGYAPNDISTFLAQDYPASFPAPVVRAYPVDNAPAPSNSAPYGTDPTAVEELTLDIEWAASTAPGATIDAVYTHDGPPPSYGPSTSNMTTAIEEALSLANSTNLTAISMSFGSSESGDTSLVSAWGPLFSEADRLGITLLAATGDTGGDTTDSSGCSGVADPQYPAVATDVIAVGGTNVTYNFSSFSEVAWDKGGGGFSAQTAAPSWQLVGSAAGPIGANGHRGMPDVSAAAADDFLYFNGAPTAAAGTSFATPMWAGLIASIDAKWGHRLGFFTDRLYHVGSVEPSGQIGIGLADVVGNANCVASAVRGWDAATGWGSPRADLFYADLLGSFVNLSLGVQPSPAAPGGSVLLTVHLANRTTGAPIAGVNVSMTVAADIPAGPCSGVFGSASPTTNLTGVAEARLPIPLCYLGLHAVASAAVTTVHYYGTNSTKVAVNLLGWFPQLAFLATSPWEYLVYTGIMGAAVLAGGLLGRWAGPPAAVRPTSPPIATTPEAANAPATPPTPDPASPTLDPVPPAGPTAGRPGSGTDGRTSADSAEPGPTTAPELDQKS